MRIRKTMEITIIIQMIRPATPVLYSSSLKIQWKPFRPRPNSSAATSASIPADWSGAKPRNTATFDYILPVAPPQSFDSIPH